MARQLKLTPATIAKIQARRVQGVPLATLAREFGLGVGSIHRALKMAPAADAAAPKPKAPAVERKGAEKAAAPPAADVDPLLELQRLNATLAALAAAADGDAAVILPVTRLTKDVLGLIAKLTPPPPPSLEDSPDMQAAAETCAAKLRAMLAQPSEGLVRCKSCGQPVREECTP